MSTNEFCNRSVGRDSAKRFLLIADALNVNRCLILVNWPLITIRRLMKNLLPKIFSIESVLNRFVETAIILSLEKVNKVFTSLHQFLTSMVISPESILNLRSKDSAGETVESLPLLFFTFFTSRF